MQTIKFMQPNGKMVAIVASKITGFTEYKDKSTFISVICNSEAIESNGFYVLESFQNVSRKIDNIKGDL